MALNQTNKLVWIVETIYRAHKISFEELNRAGWIMLDMISLLLMEIDKLY